MLTQGGMCAGGWERCESVTWHKTGRVMVHFLCQSISSSGSDGDENDSGEVGATVICTTANKLEENSRPRVDVQQKRGKEGKRFRHKREAAIFEPAAKGETERKENRNEMKLRLSEPET